MSDKIEKLPLIIFDERRFDKELANRPKDRITIFKDAIFGCQTQLNNQFLEGGDVRQLVTARARLIDRMLAKIWSDFNWSEGISLCAVGGYGREELHPSSDIDLLIITESPTKNDLNQIEQFITFLWDIQLEIGHSVRSIKECAELAKNDITIATNLIESRTLAGQSTLLEWVKKATSKKKMWGSKAFFKAKWQEQAERHAKVSGSEYSLEPNIKQAPGGLRDIQMISWIAKRHFGLKQLQELTSTGFITDEEYHLLRSGKDFLYKVRYGLHLITGRAQERLHIDHQRELAQMFGYKETNGRMAVEHFMRDYYRAVIATRELNDLLLHLFIEELDDTFWNRRTRSINKDFVRHNNAIEARDPELFQKRPGAILEMFALLAEDPTLVGARAITIRQIREARLLIDEQFRADPNNSATFMRILKAEGPLFGVLTKMHRYRILSRYLPEFGAITGLMQHDLFHVYTVDAHTLKLIEMIDIFKMGKHSDEYTIATQILNRLEQPELLYIAALYHDIAKGRGGDHSALGAVDVNRFAERHLLSKWESRLLEWLVKNHLLMTKVSQRQDLTDPEVIYNFAKETGDQLYLDYIFALTVADVNATNPELWNTWKASLMRQLYNQTLATMRRGIEQPQDIQSRIEEKQLRAINLLLDRGLTADQVHQLWNEPGEDYFLRERARDIAWHTEAFAAQTNKEAPLVLIQTRGNGEFYGSTQIFVRTKDQPRLFATLVTTLANQQLNIQDARIYNSNTGYALDTFYVLDQQGTALNNTPQNYARLRRAIIGALHNPDKVKRNAPRLERVKKHFTRPTQVFTDNDLSDHYTSIEIISPDRPGLLATLASIFANHKVQLLNAKIATFGDRVEDVFYVTDENGDKILNQAKLDQLSLDIREQLDERVEEF